MFTSSVWGFNVFTNPFINDISYKNDLDGKCNASQPDGSSAVTVPHILICIVEMMLTRTWLTNAYV